MSATLRAGRCLCGAITYTVSGDLHDVYNCHCHRCRRFTGHHLAATEVDRASLVVLDDDANLRWFHPVPQAAYGFCAGCGSSLFWHSDDEDHVWVCAGTLDPPTGLTTVQAWWVSEASDYHTRPSVPELDAE